MLPNSVSKTLIFQLLWSQSLCLVVKLDGNRTSNNWKNNQDITRYGQWKENNLPLIDRIKDSVQNAMKPTSINRDLKKGGEYNSQNTVIVTKAREIHPTVNNDNSSLLEIQINYDFYHFLKIITLICW